jgi:predicted DNA-binding protein (MmcQ/YjbR family)
MDYDVFISHSSGNKQVANAICHALEQNGVKCWIAPRDITPGVKWGGEIVNGIKGCKIFLLVFSEAANKSDDVLQEIERALHYKKTVIPFRIEDVVMSADFEYHLSKVHWLDAFPDDSVFDNLVTAVKNA